MTPAQRIHAVALMDLLHAHAGQILYPPEDQRNGVEAYDWTLTEAQLTTLLLNRHTLTFDCSDSSSWIYKAVGCHWHQGSPPGYTGTWLSLGLGRYSNGAGALKGAPCIYGIDTKPDGHHMALTHTPDPKGGNPLMSEHGTTGWAFTRHKDIVSRQSADNYPGYTFLDVSRL